MTELHITVERILYPRESDAGDTGKDWYILKTDAGTAKGPISWRPANSERLRLGGAWGIYKGERQFIFRSALPDVPVSPRDVLRYICHRTTGIGPAMESAIYAQWGDDWIAAAEPQIIPRLTGAIYLSLCDAISDFQRNQVKADAIAWLMARGATPNLSTAAWAQWGHEMPGIVQSDCYRLAEIEYRGFNDIDDNIRRAFDISDDDPRRMTAVVLYCVGQCVDIGNTVMTWPELHQAACRFVGDQYSALLTDAVARMLQDDTLYGWPDPQLIARRQDYDDESKILAWADAGCCNTTTGD